MVKLDRPRSVLVMRSQWLVVASIMFSLPIMLELNDKMIGLEDVGRI
jgi:hypothetical protein